MRPRFRIGLDYNAQRPFDGQVRCSRHFRKLTYRSRLASPILCDSSNIKRIYLPLHSYVVAKIRVVCHCLISNSGYSKKQ